MGKSDENNPKVQLSNVPIVENFTVWRSSRKYAAWQLEILEYPSVASWLNEFKNTETIKQYTKRILKFFEITNIDIQEFEKMDPKEIKKLILSFQAGEVKKGRKSNGTLALISTVRSYLVSIDKTLQFRRCQLLTTEADNDSHVFTNEDIKLIFDVGNTFEKAILATAVSEGWEISSFLNQDRETIEKKIIHATQNNAKFVFFNNTRKKTGVSRYCVLNPLAVEWLTKYLSTRKDDDPQLFPITQNGVQKLLYRLAQQSGLKTTGPLRFHNFRKWLMSRLSRCGFNEFQIKYLMGKKIGLSDATYLQTLQSEIQDKYPLIYDGFLNICPVITVKESIKELDEVKQKIEAKEKIVDALVQDVTKKNLELEELKLRILNIEKQKLAFDALLKKVEELEAVVKNR